MRASHLFAVAAVILLAVAVLPPAPPAGPTLPTIQHDGRPYVELVRVADNLEARLDTSATSVRATLTIGRQVVSLTRNWTQVLLDGKPVILDAPVRVRDGVWLVPESFITRVVSRVAVTPVPAAADAKPVVRGDVALRELRHRSYPSFTRVVVESSVPIVYRAEPARAKEARIRLVNFRAEPKTEEVRDGFIDEVRLERAGGDAILRVVFEGAAGEFRPTTFTDPPRLMLDFKRPDAGDRAGAETLGPLRTLVLDAGHGGHDSGAVGPTGLMEKDLVLDVTKRVARLAGDQLGVKVLLSRDSDQFIALKDRTSSANRERADLFVSIHANAHREIASEGVEVYFLSSEATDNAARQVAALENSSVQLEKTNGRGGSRTDIVKAILWDLAQSEFQIESSRLAEVVLDAMTRSLRIQNRGVKQAGFYVLGGAAMPAVLIEIGFVTNPREERKLRDGRYRDEIARAILGALAEYKRNWDQRARPVADHSR
ncbi:MAG: N-acetylmuramoyl-L-alanine amidase [Candidatus Rokubacteria bacterium]|nr:N-acetylmuramoyl-L-alanine amidase [Candidatus Rokubacteria bacterium]